MIKSIAVKSNFIIKLTVYILFVLLISSCDKLKVSETSSKEVEKKVSEAISKAKGLFSEFDLESAKDIPLQKMAQDEVDKLFSVEYKVIEIDDVGDMAHINAVLNKAGKDRWDCFSSEHVQKKYRFFCKRRPQSYLRYFTRGF